LKGGARLFGMRRFRVRDAAGALAEAPALSALRRGGVLVPRHVPVQVSEAGGAPGPRIIEDGFSKELLEAQERRDGVLFRFAATFPEVRVDPYGAKKIRKSDQRLAQLENAVGLLTGFLRGDLAAREVFDVALLARFLAVVEVWSAAASLEGANLRFYFNPITQRIEPIAHRVGPGLLATDAVLVTRSAPWAARILEDDELRERFVEALRGLSLELAEASDAVSPERISRARRLAEAGVPGASGAGRAVRATPKALALASNPVPTASLEQVLADHPFLEWVESRGVLRGAPGEWWVRGSLVLPEGIGLELGPGTTLRFEPTAMLLATGPLRFVGAAEAPVVLEAGRGVAQESVSWQGVAVLRSSEPHVWEHVVVRETTGIDRAGWALTGGVTFRSSEVQISESLFEAARGEDALNLIRSRFAFSGLSIHDTASDAFDGDFCGGTIRGGRIEAVGGDGIDVSGSEVTVEGVRLVGIRDKALSIGEKSRVTARDLRIENVGTAAASKDGSELVLANTTVSDVHHVALMAYTKKAEYGPAHLSASQVEMIRVAKNAVVQHGSHLRVDDAELAAGPLDVDRLYESGPMQK